MCRLFGLTAGTERVHASFWLLSAPDSIVAQSHREPDGTGIGWFDPDGSPRIDKQPLAAFDDPAFQAAARDVEASNVVAHVRFASTGGRTTENTHPFEQRGRIFCQNGVIEDLPRLEAQLGDYRDLVRGDTDSERFFALVTKEIDERGGDVEAGIVAAARFAARELPIFAINLLLIEPNGLWALRYPDTHGLLVCERPAGDSIDRVTSTGARVKSEDLAETDCVLVASERLDDEDGWRSLASGELIHIGDDLRVHTTTAVSGAPTHPLTLADLGASAAASQSGLRDQPPKASTLPPAAT